MRSYIPQSEEQFFLIRTEGESSQETWPNQDADLDQVDLSDTHQETNHSIYQILYYLYCSVCFNVMI